MVEWEAEKLMAEFFDPPKCPYCGLKRSTVRELVDNVNDFLGFLKNNNIHTSEKVIQSLAAIEELINHDGKNELTE